MESMKELFTVASEHAILVVDALALVIIVFAALEAFIKGIRAMFSPLTGQERRDIWLRFARWLVAALTFQLAADIIESAITESWEAVGRLAAVALIRTFLDYFLERDMNEVRGTARATETPAPGS